MKKQKSTSFEDRLDHALQNEKIQPKANRKTKKKRAIEKAETNPSHLKFLNISSELIGGILSGLGFGLLLDYFFKTKPLFLAIMLPFGAFIGLYNVYRHTLKSAHIKPPKKQLKHSVKKD